MFKLMKFFLYYYKYALKHSIFFFLGRRKSQSESVQCPICGITLREGEMNIHFVDELLRLRKIGSSTPRHRKTYSYNQHNNSLDSSSSSSSTLQSSAGKKII